MWVAIEETENGNVEGALDHLEKQARSHVRLALAGDDDAGELRVRFEKQHELIP